MSEHALTSKLNVIFKPSSVAVVGASTRAGTVGNDIFRNLLFNEFNGSVYPINPKANNVLGVHCYPDLLSVPGSVDLAVVIVPSSGILQVVDQAIEKQVQALVVISAGFKEVGGKGVELERQLQQKVRAAGIPLIGPNCLGVINTDPAVRMNAAFGRKMPGPGNLAFLSQSGALCTSVLDYAEERHMGFSKFISFGNKADVNEIDLLEYLANDPTTDVIAMYLEDISDGRRFIETVRKIFWETHKPMLCLKSGRTPEGRQGGQQPHGVPGRFRLGLRRAAGPERRAACRHDCRTVRLGGVVLHAAAAARRTGRDHHERRRAGHHGHGLCRPVRAEIGRTQPRDARRNSRHPCPRPRPCAIRST